MSNEQNQSDAKAHPVDTIVMQTFLAKDIGIHFKNVELVEKSNFTVFRVFNEHGSDTGIISFHGGNEWRVYVDNFPAQKKYFSWNLPIKTLEDFISDITRTGLHLERA